MRGMMPPQPAPPERIRQMLSHQQNKIPSFKIIKEIRDAPNLQFVVSCPFPLTSLISLNLN